MSKLCGLIMPSLSLVKYYSCFTLKNFPKLKNQVLVDKKGVKTRQCQKTRQKTIYHVISNKVFVREIDFCSYGIFSKCSLHISGKFRKWTNLRRLAVEYLRRIRAHSECGPELSLHCYGHGVPRRGGKADRQFPLQLWVYLSAHSMQCRYAQINTAWTELHEWAGKSFSYKGYTIRLEVATYNLLKISPFSAHFRSMKQIYLDFGNTEVSEKTY